MASFYKLGGGRWRAQVRRQGFQTSKTFSHKADAKEWARETERKIDRGENHNRKGPKHLRTVGDLVDQHIEDMLEVGKPLRRSKEYSLLLLKDRLGNRDANSLSRQSVIDFGRQRAREGAGPVTVATDLSYLKTILTHAAAVHGVKLSTEEVGLARVALTRLGLVGKSNERDRRPTQQEIDDIVSHLAENDRQITPVDRIIKFAIASAMRQSEICSIKWADVDERRRTVLVRDRKDPRKKVGNNQRVPLTDLTGYDAWAIIQEQKNYSGNQEKIFPYSPKTVGTAFRRSRDKLGIEDLTFHDFRHEATSRLFEAGLTIERVALVTGHKDWKMLKRYTHLSPDMVFHRPEVSTATK